MSFAIFQICSQFHNFSLKFFYFFTISVDFTSKPMFLFLPSALLLLYSIRIFGSYSTCELSGQLSWSWVIDFLAATGWSSPKLAANIWISLRFTWVFPCCLENLSRSIGFGRAEHEKGLIEGSWMSLINWYINGMFLGLRFVSYAVLLWFCDSGIQFIFGLFARVKTEVVTKWEKKYLKEDLSKSWGFILVSHLLYKTAEKVSSASTEQ